MKGSIRKRGNRWEVNVYAGRDPITGKRRYVSRRTDPGAPRSAADDLAAEVITEVRQGRHAGTKAGSVAQLFEEWFRLASPDWSPYTIVRARQRYSCYVKPRIGELALGKLTVGVLDRFYAELRREGGRKDPTTGQRRPLAQSTVARIHTDIHRALEYAVRWDWLAANPADRAKPKKGPKAKGASVPPELVGRLLAHAVKSDPPLAVYLGLAAVTGARRGELCALRWRDVDLEERMVHITRALVDAGAGDIREKGTKEDDHRHLPLGDATVAILKAYRAEMRPLAMELGIGFTAETPVFFSDHPKRLGEWWRPDNVNHRFRRLREAAEVGPVKPHQLRHAAGTWMANGGIPTANVSKRLGHKRQSTTVDMYVDAVDSRDREAAELLDGLVFPKRASSS